MDQYEPIRTAKRAYGKSIREIARDTGHHRVTIRKALCGEEPKYRRRKRVKCAVMDVTRQRKWDTLGPRVKRELKGLRGWDPTPSKGCS